MFHIQCTKENLLEGLEQALLVAAKNPQLPVLNHCLIKADQGSITVSATNLEIGIERMVRGKVISEGACVAPVKVLADFVRNASGSLELEETKGAISITTERSKTVLHTIPVDEFPEIPWPQHDRVATIHASGLLDALQGSMFAASSDQHRPEWQSVFVLFSETGFDVVSTDGCRLSRTFIPEQLQGIPEMSMIVPLRSAQLLGRLLEANEGDTVSWSIEDHQIAITYGATRMLTRLLSAKYPDYKNVIPQTGSIICQVATKDLLAAVRNAGLFCRPGIQDIRCDFSKESITVTGSSDVLGESSTTVPAATVGNTISVVFNVRYIQDALQHIATPWVLVFINHQHQPVVFVPTPDKLQLNENPTTSTLLSSANRVVLVMPIKQ